MEVECLALKDLTSPRKSLSVGAEEEEEDEGQTEQKVKGWNTEVPPVTTGGKTRWPHCSSTTVSTAVVL